MKKRFLAALFVAVMVLGLAGAVTAEDLESEDELLPISDGNFIYWPLGADGQAVEMITIVDENSDPKEVKQTDDVTGYKGKLFDSSKITTISAYSVIRYVGETRDATIRDRFNDKPVTEIGRAEITVGGKTITSGNIQDDENGNVQVDGESVDVDDILSDQSQSQFVFAGTKLEGEVKIPNSVRKINIFAFTGAPMTSIVIPGSVETIDQCAFYHHTSLRYLDILGYADTRGQFFSDHTRIMPHAFDGCESLQGSISSKGVLQPLYIPSSVKTIGVAAFKNCSQLEELVLPISVTNINDYAFAGCTNLVRLSILGSIGEGSSGDLAETAFPWTDLIRNTNKNGLYVHCRFENTLKLVSDKIEAACKENKYNSETYLQKVHYLEINKDQNNREQDGQIVVGHDAADLCKGDSYAINGSTTLSFKCAGYYKELSDTDTNPGGGNTGGGTGGAGTSKLKLQGNGSTADVSEVTGNIDQDGGSVSKTINAVFDASDLGISEEDKVTLSWGDLPEGVSITDGNTSIRELDLVEKDGSGSTYEGTFTVVVSEAANGTITFTVHGSNGTIADTENNTAALTINVTKSEGTGPFPCQLDPAYLFEITRDVSALYHQEHTLTEAEKLDPSNRIEPTCTEQGTVTVIKCDYCGEALVSDKIPALGHYFDADKWSDPSDDDDLSLSGDCGNGLIGYELSFQVCWRENCGALNRRPVDEDGNVIPCEGCNTYEEDLKKAEAILNPDRQREAIDAARRAYAEHLDAEDSVHINPEVTVKVTRTGHTWERYEDDYPVPYDCAMDHLTVTRRRCSVCGIVEGLGYLEDGGDTDNTQYYNLSDLCFGYITQLKDAKAAIEALRDDGAAAQADDTSASPTDAQIALQAAYDDYNEVVANYKEHLDKDHPDLDSYDEDSDSVTGESQTLSPVNAHVDYADDYVREVGHSGRPKGTYAPGEDCETGGTVTYPAYTCTVCGAYIGESTEQVGPESHSRVPRSEPTGSNNCLEPTAYEWEECEDCGKILTEKTPVYDPEDRKHHAEDGDPGELVPSKSKEATCTDDGWEVRKYICKDCGEEFEDDPVPIKAEGHKWGDFVPAEGQDTTQGDNCKKPVKGAAICSVCGWRSEEVIIPIPGKLGHTWDEEEWTVTKEPTATEPGVGTWHCMFCYPYDKTAIETRSIPALGSGSGDDGSGDNTGDDNTGDDNTGSDNTDDGDTSTDTTSYTITVIQGVSGTVTPSPRSSATSGTSVTITVRPNSGYELDELQVRGTATGREVSTANRGGGEYRFTMPAENVEVRAYFKRAASNTNANWTGSSSGSSSSSSSSQNVVQSIPQASAAGQQLFRDIPATHWAAGEINWANRMGYMNGGSNGAFNPNGNISHQQLWMVLARLTGSNPTSMADARRWAVNSGYADGADPAASVSRHQLVTALYRCAHLMGTSNRNTTTLAGFADSRLVPTPARDAFAWAVANGIIGGNAEGRLDPNGTLTRAQFAVILYRFSQRV